MSVSVSDIISFLGKQTAHRVKGNPHITVESPAPIHEAQANHISFMVRTDEIGYDLVAQSKAGIILCPIGFIPLQFELSQKSLIFVRRPRLTFIRILYRFFYSLKKQVPLIHETVITGKNVSIGKGTQIYPNVVIGDNVTIGRNCLIETGAIIGADGFGYAREHGIWVQFPQIGSVVIGDNVRIGYQSTVDRGTLGKTIIENRVKIDNYVHIGHNCQIGQDTLITAFNQFSGGVKIGRDCYIAPRCSFIDYIEIGDNTFIGIGSLVVKNIPAGVVAYGHPAKVIRKWIGFE